MWLTVPVIKKGRYNQLIRDVRIDNGTNWRNKHLKRIESSYKNAPNFEDCTKKLNEIYAKNHRFLIDLNMDLLDWVAADINPHTVEDTGRKGLSVESVLRCALLKQYRQLSYEDLVFCLMDSASCQTFARLSLEWFPKKSVLQGCISAISDAMRSPIQLPAEGISVRDVETALISQALARTGGNVTQAAKLVGLTRDTLRYRMQKYAL